MYVNGVGYKFNSHRDHSFCKVNGTIYVGHMNTFR